MKAMCPLLRRDSFSEEDQLQQHSDQPITGVKLRLTPIPIQSIQKAPQLKRKDKADTRMYPIPLVDTSGIGLWLRLNPQDVQLFKNSSPNVRLILDIMTVLRILMNYSNTQVLVDNQVKSFLDKRNGYNTYLGMKEQMVSKYILKLKDLIMKPPQKELKSLNKR
ncbi:unnamed protein product [Paramecium pentaurelia]|uniref:Uncharacterized protein n=1 Tax=Paramecium pentaurelia TaxID=43138 RepID=A0A8S1UZV5_9CILI|nr:unnamed protein product [Paramecium pentaurelia]